MVGTGITGQTGHDDLFQHGVILLQHKVLFMDRTEVDGLDNGQVTYITDLYRCLYCWKVVYAIETFFISHRPLFQQGEIDTGSHYGTAVYGIRHLSLQRCLLSQWLG